MSVADGIPVKNRHGKTVGYVDKVQSDNETTFVSFYLTDHVAQEMLKNPDIVDYLYLGIEDKRLPEFTAKLMKGNQ